MANAPQNPAYQPTYSAGVNPPIDGLLRGGQSPVLVLSSRNVAGTTTVKHVETLAGDTTVFGDPTNTPSTQFKASTEFRWFFGVTNVGIWQATLFRFMGVTAFQFNSVTSTTVSILAPTTDTATGALSDQGPAAFAAATGTNRDGGQKRDIGGTPAVGGVAKGFTGEWQAAQMCIEGREVAANQRILALVHGTALTAAAVGVGPGDRVVFVSPANVQTTVRPPSNGGMLLPMGAGGPWVAWSPNLTWSLVPKSSNTANTQLRNFITYADVGRTTDGLTPVTLVTIPTVSGAGYEFTLRVLAKNVANIDLASVKRSILANNVAGVITISQVNLIALQQIGASLATVAVNVVAVGTNIEVQALGVAATTIDWQTTFPSQEN